MQQELWLEIWEAFENIKHVKQQQQVKYDRDEKLPESLGYSSWLRIEVVFNKQYFK